MLSVFSKMKYFARSQPFAYAKMWEYLGNGARWSLCCYKASCKITISP